MANVHVYENGSVEYRASSLGLCVRRLVAERLGETPQPVSDRTQGYFDRGKEVEPLILGALSYPLQRSLDGEQEEVRIEVANEVTKRLAIVGHIDGRRDHPDDPRGVEAKSVSPGVMDSWERAGLVEFLKGHRIYALQVNTYMWATGVPFDYIVGEILTDENGGYSLGRVLTESLMPWIPLDAIKQRVIDIEEMAWAERLPDCDVASNWDCPFRHLGCTNVAPAAARASGDEAEELDYLLGRLYKVNRLLNTLDAIKTEIRPRISKLMGSQDRVVAGKYGGLRSRVMQKRLDQKKVRQYLGDDVDQFEYESWSERIIPKLAEKMRTED